MDDLSRRERAPSGTKTGCSSAAAIAPSTPWSSRSLATARLYGIDPHRSDEQIVAAVESIRESDPDNAAREYDCKGVRRRLDQPKDRGSRRGARAVRGHALPTRGLPSLAPGVLAGARKPGRVSAAGVHPGRSRESRHVSAILEQHRQDGGGPGRSFAGDSSAAPTRGQNPSRKCREDKSEKPRFTGAFQVVARGRNVGWIPRYYWILKGR